MSSPTPNTTPPPHQSSIPGYRPTPYLTRKRTVLLTLIAIIPITSYLWLQRLETKSRERTRLLEEEGRKNWIQAEKEKQRYLAMRKDRDLSVAVGRSGGGV